MGETAEGLVYEIGGEVMRYVFFDLETGGTEPKHPDIQLAAVAVENGVELDSLEVKIKFDPALCEPKALEINHYSADDWKDAVSEESAIKRFAAFCKEYSDVPKVSARTGNGYRVARAGGHNVARFDFDRVMALAKRRSVFLPLDFYTLDTFQAAIWYFTAHPPFPENLRLETLCKHFGIEISNAHEALSDVRASVALARKLVGAF